MPAVSYIHYVCNFVLQAAQGGGGGRPWARHLGLAKHPDKTFIGRIEKGFDFLGGPVDRERLTVAKATVERLFERAPRLYEQRPGEPEGSRRLGRYVRRWAQWIGAGLGQGESIRSCHFGSPVGVL